VTDPQVALMMLGIFIILVFLGFPIAFTLMALGIGFGYYAYFDAGRQWRGLDRLEETAGTLRDLVGLVRGVPEQPHLRPLHQPDLYGDVERGADRGAAVPVHGLRGRAGEHRRQAVLDAQHRGEEPPRLDGRRRADHLCAVRDRDRHRRGGGDADGPAGAAGDAEGPLQPQPSPPASSARAARSAS
jgi:hypothetical protein